MPKNLEMVTLLDFYGQFITPKQLDIAELYFCEDLSLGEIAEHERITRQGVLDVVKRAEDTLVKMEQRLNLRKKHTEQERVKDNIKDLCGRITEITQQYKYLDEVNDLVKEIKEEIETI
ncbi:MAG: DNA-binding protein [Oscillospiraceae bacterium]|nr:DNA-binding protein [Oscillospiraceae bacterium]